MTYRPSLCKSASLLVTGNLLILCREHFEEVRMEYSQQFPHADIFRRCDSLDDPSPMPTSEGTRCLAPPSSNRGALATTSRYVSTGSRWARDCFTTDGPVPREW